MNDRSREVFRIGDWLVDPAIDEISRAGIVNKLEPRAMRVLVCLAERAGVAATRESGRGATILQPGAKGLKEA